MKLRRIFASSICLNLILALTVVCRLKQTASHRRCASAPKISETTNLPIAASVAAPTNSPAQVTFVTNHFVWSKVEAADFEQLAVNLRAIGCPEKTVRDVVFARARRALQQASRSAGPKLAFWTIGSRRSRAKREVEREVAAARAKILASVERAVGRGVFNENTKWMEDFVEQAIVRFLSGPMSEEKFSRLAVLLTRQEARCDEVRARSQGVWLEEDEAALQSLGRRFHQELEEVLGQVELEEFTSRLAMQKLAEQIRFEATDLSLAEIREVALIRARFDDPTTHEWFNGDSLTDQQEGQFKKAVQEFLGESRCAQVERARDADFKALFELGRDNHLQQVAAVNAFELRQLTQQEVVRLREDNDLPEADRQQRVAQMQTHVQECVLKVLGTTAFAQYLSQGGGWLTNISGL